MMLYNQLGSSDLFISNIGLGCMSLPVNDVTETGYLLEHAIASGINFFDTADLYDHGLNETIVGKLLRGKRNEVLIATKVGNQWRPDGSGFDWNPSRQHIVQSVEESLQRLQTDHIDLYQLHGGTIEDNIDETIGAFELLKQQGKIRYYGISSIRPNVIREYVKRSAIVSVMSQYSLVDRRPEESILPLLQQNNIGVLSRGALAQGMLINKPAKDHLGHDAASISNAAAKIMSMQNEERSAAQVALRFVLDQPSITSAIVGVSKIAQLNDVAAAAGVAALGETERTELENLLPALSYSAAVQ